MNGNTLEDVDLHTNQGWIITKGNEDQTGASTLSHDKACNTMEQEAHQLVGPAKRRATKIRPITVGGKNFELRYIHRPEVADDGQHERAWKIIW